METKFYTIDQIAEKLGMHHKTIRKFITDGKLGASKVGKQWRISEYDLTSFVENNNVGNINKMPGGETDIKFSTFSDEEISEQNRINISSVVDINKVDKNEYMRISNTLIAVANSKDTNIGKSTINVKYDEMDKRLRVLLWGNIKFIESMLDTISILVEEDV